MRSAAAVGVAVLQRREVHRDLRFLDREIEGARREFDHSRDLGAELALSAGRRAWGSSTRQICPVGRKDGAPGSAASAAARGDLPARTAAEEGSVLNGEHVATLQS